jgi:replicative DNA helicase
MESNDILLPDVSERPDLDIRPISGWFNEWVEGIKEEKNKISLKFPLFDHEIRGKLRGKLCVIIHYGGTKKSLLAQNIAHYNIFNNKHRVIYSSMEMGVVELGSRFIDIQTNVEETDDNASEFLEYTHRTDPVYVKKVLSDHVAPAYGDRLQITQNSGLTCDEYKILIDRVELNTGPVDMLIVDGLSMMGGKGTEMELANLHTRGLKELAKDRNILVLCIVHAARGGTKHDRDVSKHARGSEKIIDNCDFYICPSLITSTIEEYRKDIGYLRLVNKRGSGNTVNMIYTFNPKRLLMSQSTYDPKEYDNSNIKDTGF